MITPEDYLALAERLVQENTEADWRTAISRAYYDSAQGTTTVQQECLKAMNGLSRMLQLQRPLPSTLMFDYPTIDAIAGHLFERLNPAAAPAAPMPPAAKAAVPMSAADVAALRGADIERLLEERWSDR